jgi:hypothetical protein
MPHRGNITISIIPCVALTGQLTPFTFFLQSFYPYGIFAPHYLLLSYICNPSGCGFGHDYLFVKD